MRHEALRPVVHSHAFGSILCVACCRHAVASMNASNAFRSHLMQQFVAAARTQSRPPLALIGIASSEEDGHRLLTLSSSSSSTASASHGPPLVRHSSLRRRPSFGVSGIAAPPSPSSARPTGTSTSQYHCRPLTSTSLNDEKDEHTSLVDIDTTLSTQFQNLLQTRRTSSRFANPEAHQDASYWKDALDRAVECGLMAPNHNRTEPFRFKRLLAPSASTQRLAEIVYQVSLDADSDHDAAARKRDKWNHIPAFLVTLVESPQISANDVTTTTATTTTTTTTTTSPYAPLPFVPPTTERELEDYASACAAVQNILLSLHAEHVASKWATGPVVRTTAFRQLVQARPQDRVVALVMVGGRQRRQQQPRKRRLHRPLALALEDLE